MTANAAQRTAKPRAHLRRVPRRQLNPEHSGKLDVDYPAGKIWVGNVVVWSLNPQTKEGTYVDTWFLQSHQIEKVDMNRTH